MSTSNNAQVALSALQKQLDDFKYQLHFHLVELFATHGRFKQFTCSVLEIKNAGKMKELRNVAFKSLFNGKSLLSVGSLNVDERVLCLDRYVL